jgi:hypothetical protein
MTAVVYGRSGLREFFGRLVRWRAGAKAYAIVFLTPILICLVAVGITLCFASLASTLSSEKLREVPERFLFIFLFIGRGEETRLAWFRSAAVTDKIFSVDRESHSRTDLGALASPARWKRIPMANCSRLSRVALRRHFYADVAFQSHQWQRLSADALSRDG